MNKLAVIFLSLLIACGAVSAGSGLIKASAMQAESSLCTQSEGKILMKSDAATNVDGQASKQQVQVSTSEDASKIRELVNQVEGVQESVVIAYGDNVGVAIKTKGIFLASQDKKIRNEIETKIKENFPQYNNVIVLTRVKDYYSLKGLEAQLNEGANPLEIYKTLIEIYKTPKRQLPDPGVRKKDTNKS